MRLSNSLTVVLQGTRADSKHYGNNKTFDSAGTSDLYSRRREDN